jgi:hypothetical protein
LVDSNLHWKTQERPKLPLAQKAKENNNKTQRIKTTTTNNNTKVQNLRLIQSLAGGTHEKAKNHNPHFPLTRK